MRLISTEFRLVVECCRRAFCVDNDGAIHRMASKVDWDRVVLLARFHRVQGLVSDSLHSAGTELPAGPAEALSADARRIVATNLRIAAEARELRAAFADAGIPLLLVKGLTLAALAYPKPVLKMGWDIDLLTADDAVVEAAAVLAARGYRRTIPAPDADLAAWHARRKESVWSRPEEHLHVELHTRLADNREIIPGIGLASPPREVEVVSGISLPTLGPDELFAYLCVHGASSLWFRLKWITDLAALLARETAEGIERLYERSQELGAGRAADQALLLADDFYGTLEGSSLAARLERDSMSRRLTAAAFRQLAANCDGRDPTDVRLGTFAIHWTQLLLRPGARFALGEAARQLRDAVA